MDYLKYAAFALSFTCLVIEKFTKTNKNDKPEFQKSTSLGRTLIFFSILTFGIGIWQTIEDDWKNKKAQESASAQRTKDSILIAKRWEV
ncbi:MAG: hypothetical protein WKG06_31460 [Segetibacter sp.]